MNMFYIATFNLEEFITALNGYASEGETFKYTLSNPHSYRGAYDCLAFEIEEGDQPALEWKNLVEKQIETTHEGWKGGDYIMSKYTDVYFVRRDGETGVPVSNIMLSLMVAKDSLNY